MTTPVDLIEQGVSGLHPTDDTAAARAVARANGWRIVELDTSHGTDKTYFLQVCRQAFDLPQWFGGNWDALADSLTDVDDTPGTLVIWAGRAPWRRSCARPRPRSSLSGWTGRAADWAFSWCWSQPVRTTDVA